MCVSGVYNYYPKQVCFIQKIYIFYKSSILKVHNCNYILKGTMEHKYCNFLKPPETVRGMTELDRNLFSKAVQVSVLDVNITVIKNILPSLKKYYLKLSNFKSLRCKCGLETEQKCAILDPRIALQWNDLKEEDRLLFEENGINNDNLRSETLLLKYENFAVDELLQAILPEEQHGVAGFSQIGHIVHLNLKDHNLKYKTIIGNILLDKIPNCRTVVNKIDQINNEYRNFEMEVLCGEQEMVVAVKENHCIFEFDFSKVYFNPRLGTEHKRLVDKLKHGDVLYDVFAGVGPFTIPALKKKCLVIANDLNPESVKWLRHNAKKNKINCSLLQIHQLDGKEFIRSVMKVDLLTHLNENKTIHIVMNLPALAPTFLDALRDLYSIENLCNVSTYPTVYVYCFAKGENKEKLAREQVEQGLGYSLENILEELYFVRTVSNFKHMLRVSFKLTPEILTGINQDEHPPKTKKMCFEEKSCG